MPGIVAPANPITVLPVGLSRSFTERRVFRTLVSGPYADGRDQRRSEAITSRKEWMVARRLTYGDWITLRTFYLARRGPTEEFYFYPRVSDHDPTGGSAVGRYIVRFAGNVSWRYGLSRIESDFSLIEVA